jgi:hypothetical protein
MVAVREHLIVVLKANPKLGMARPKPTWPPAGWGRNSKFLSVQSLKPEHGY